MCKSTSNRQVNIQHVQQTLLPVSRCIWSIQVSAMCSWMIKLWHPLTERLCSLLLVDIIHQKSYLEGGPSNPPTVSLVNVGLFFSNFDCMNASKSCGSLHLPKVEIGLLKGRIESILLNNAHVCLWLMFRMFKLSTNTNISFPSMSWSPLNQSWLRHTQ